MYEIIFYVIFFVIAVRMCIAVATSKKRKGLNYVKSTIDNEEYLVRDKNLKSANTLALLQNKIRILMNHIKENDKYSTKRSFRRIIENGIVPLQERSYQYNKEAAYNVNKGELIGICIERKELVKENMMMFVLLHEYAHVMTKNYAHNEEFWNNFGELLECSEECGIYRHEEYSKTPRDFCGHVINYTPYKK